MRKKSNKSPGPPAVSLQRVISQPDIKHLARANGALVESHRNRRGEVPEGMEMVAFMAVFHPEIKGKKLKALIG